MAKRVFHTTFKRSVRKAVNDDLTELMQLQSHKRRVQSVPNEIPPHLPGHSSHSQISDTCVESNRSNLVSDPCSSDSSSSSNSSSRGYNNSGINSDFSNDVGLGDLSDCDIYCECRKEISDVPNINAISEQEVSNVETSEVVRDENPDSVLAEELGKWAVRFNIPIIAFRSLSLILRKFHVNLPKDPRTILGIKPVQGIEIMGVGEYYYFGIKNPLLNIIRRRELAPFTLKLQFNIDGLPIFNSSSKEFWPILCRISNMNIPPFPCAVWFGTGKPILQPYLKDFVPELSKLLQDGLYDNDSHFPVQLDCFICDTPAKSFSKETVGHTGYYGCDKCNQKGFWVGRMTYPDCWAELRTDESFANKSQSSHHKGTSPLCALNVGMVSKFLLDYLHLVCLGVVRWTLLWMLKGKKGVKRRLIPNASMKVINKRLKLAYNHWPRDFNRPPGSFENILRWKATEFRAFLLYLCVVILRSTVIGDEYYRHLVKLHVAITILIRGDLIAQHKDLAHEMLTAFVQDGKVLYGSEFLVHNVHNLLHLVDDCKLYGKLDNFSAFPFENELHVLKMCIRGRTRPLQQLINRVNERLHLVGEDRRPVLSDGVCKETSKKGPMLDLTGICYRKLNFKGRTITLLKGDNAIELSDRSIVCAENFVLTRDQLTYIVGKRFLSYEDLYTTPILSSSLGIRKVSKLSHITQKWSVDKVCCKVVLVPIKVHLQLFHSPTDCCV